MILAAKTMHSSSSASALMVGRVGTLSVRLPVLIAAAQFSFNHGRLLVCLADADEDDDENDDEQRKKSSKKKSSKKKSRKSAGQDIKLMGESGQSMVSQTPRRIS